MVNIKDIAKEASVSVMTVSRVFNNPDSVNENTRARILKIAKKMNYVPNKIARGLVTNSTNTVGVIFSNIFNSVYSSIILGIENKAKELDYDVLINNATDYKSSIKSLNALIEQRVDGLIVLPFEPEGMNSNEDSQGAIAEMCEFYDYLTKTVEKIGIPCLIIDIETNSKSIKRVAHNYKKAAKIGMEYLFNNNFKKIHYLTSTLKEGLWKDRCEVYTSMMKEKGLEDEIQIMYCLNSTDSAFEIVKNMLLVEGNKMEVLYCANDIMAIGAIQAISSLGYKIPEDVSIIGNDGIYIGEMTVPKLTSVDINSVEVGKKSMELFIKIIEKKDVEDCFVVEPHMVIRNSVKNNIELL